MRIPFTKAHGAGNDFLLTWINEAPVDGRMEAAKAICERHTGIGADGWLLVSQPGPDETDINAAIQLYNSDGSIRIDWGDECDRPWLFRPDLEPKESAEHGTLIRETAYT